MLRISFKNDAAFLEAMRSKGPKIIAALTSKVTQLMFQLAGYIASRKLSGQVLAVRTGVLRASVVAIPTTVQGTTIVGAVESSAPPAGYGAVHEFGGSRVFEILPVKARALRFMMDGKIVFRARVSHPPLPKRPFMAPSLDENAADITEALQETVKKAILE